MTQYLNLLDRVIGDSKTLSKTEFENVYKGNPIKIILHNPYVVNDSVPLYRGRLAEYVGENEDLSRPATFSYVPLALNEKGLPRMGRLNYKGQSIFYASERMKTNFNEISKDCKIGDEAYMSKWILKPNSNLHLYRTIPAWGVCTDNASGCIFTITDPNIVNGELGLYLKRVGYIMMSNEEIGKYLGSSYIANCIYSSTGFVRNPKGKDFNFHYDGIVYPSAVGGSKDVNIALKPEFVDKHLELECVIKGRLSPDMRFVNYEKIGINEGGNIVWYESFIDENSIIDIVPQYFDLHGNYIDVSKGQILDADDSVLDSRTIPFDQVLKYHSKELFSTLVKFTHTIIKETQTITKTSLEKSTSLGIIREFNGWKLVDGARITALSRVLYIITLKNQLREISPEDVR